MVRKTAGYGWHPDLPDSRDRLYHLEHPILRASLPPRVDLSPRMPPIVNQGQLGSCTGNGIARVLAYQALVEGETLPGLSESNAGFSRLFIYYGERALEGTVDQDSGAQIRDGIKVVAENGAPPESAWPYDIAQFAVKPPGEVYAEAADHKAIAYHRVIPGGGRMRSAVAAGLPIVFGFTVYSLFENGSWNPATQVLPLPGPNDSVIGGHCVVAVGYDWTCGEYPVPHFLCANSWGAGWGQQGYFRMDARYFQQLAQDLWTISRVE